MRSAAGFHIEMAPLSSIVMMASCAAFRMEARRAVDWPGARLFSVSACKPFRSLLPSRRVGRQVKRATYRGQQLALAKRLL